MSVSSTRTIDPCNKTRLYHNEEFFHSIRVDPPIGQLLNASEFLVVPRIEFENAGSINVVIKLAVALRNFGGNTSLRWFPSPEATGCDILGIALPDTHTIVMSVRWQPNEQLTVQDSSVCNFTISTDAFQCQLLTDLAFNFSLSIFVVAPDPLIPDNILKLAALLGTISASVLGAAVGGGLVLQQSRAQTVLGLANCQFSLVSKLQFSDSPTGLGLGNPIGRYFRGAVVGNIAVLSGVALSGLTICIIGGIVNMKRRGETLFDGSLRMARLIHFPGIIVFPLSFTFDNTIASSVSLLFHPIESYDKALGIFGICFLLFFIVAPIMYLTMVAFGCILVKTVLPHDSFFAQVPAGVSAKGVLRSLLVPEMRWESSPGRPYFKRMFLMIFNEYKVRYFLVIELLASAVVGVAGGVNISERSVCNALALTCFIVLGLFVLILIVIRPNSQLFGFFFSALLNFLTFLSCMFLFMSTQLRDRKYAYYSAVVSLCVGLVVVMKLLLDLFGAYLWASDKVKKVLHKGNSDDFGDTEMTNRKKALEDLISGVDGGEVASLHDLEDFLRVVTEEPIGEDDILPAPVSVGPAPPLPQAEEHRPKGDGDDFPIDLGDLDIEAEEDDIDAILSALDAPETHEGQSTIVLDDDDNMVEVGGVAAEQRRRRMGQLRRSLAGNTKRKLSRKVMLMGKTQSLLGNEAFDDPLLLRPVSHEEVHGVTAAADAAMALLTARPDRAVPSASQSVPADDTELGPAETAPGQEEPEEAAPGNAAPGQEVPGEAGPDELTEVLTSPNDGNLPNAEQQQQAVLDAVLLLADEDGDTQHEEEDPLQVQADEGDHGIGGGGDGMLDALLQAIEEMPPDPPVAMNFAVLPPNEVPEEIDPETI